MELQHAKLLSDLRDRLQEASAKPDLMVALDKLERALEAEGNDPPKTQKGSILIVKSVPDWEKVLKAETVKALKKRATKNTVGSFKSKGKKVEFVTLYASVIIRHTVLASLVKPDTLEQDIARTMKDRLAPVLEKVQANFNVVGCLAPPSFLELAITDLSTPYAVFCFVAIEKTPDYVQKLDQLGLKDLLNEGAVSTIPEVERPSYRQWVAGGVVTIEGDLTADMLASALGKPSLPESGFDIVMLAENSQGKRFVFPIFDGLTQSAIEEAHVFFAMLFDEMPRIHVTAAALSAYNKLCFPKERVVISGDTGEPVKL